MAVTQADIDNLEAALMSGELEVEYDGKKVTYRSVGELIGALKYARDQLQPAAGYTLAEFHRS